MSLLDAPASPHYFSPEHVQFRDMLRGWVSREITPHVNDWDEADSGAVTLIPRLGNAEQVPRGAVSPVLGGLRRRKSSP